MQLQSMLDGVDRELFEFGNIDCDLSLQILHVGFRNFHFGRLDESPMVAAARMKKESEMFRLAHDEIAFTPAASVRPENSA